MKLRDHLTGFAAVAIAVLSSALPALRAAWVDRRVPASELPCPQPLRRVTLGLETPHPALVGQGWPSLNLWATTFDNAHRSTAGII